MSRHLFILLHQTCSRVLVGPQSSASGIPKDTLTSHNVWIVCEMQLFFAFLEKGEAWN